MGGKIADWVETNYANAPKEISVKEFKEKHLEDFKKKFTEFIVPCIEYAYFNTAEKKSQTNL